MKFLSQTYLVCDFRWLIFALLDLLNVSTLLWMKQQLPSNFLLIGCSSFNLQKTNPKTGEVSDTPVGMMDVYQEFNELSEKFKIMKFKSKVSLSLAAFLSYLNGILRKAVSHGLTHVLVWVIWVFCLHRKSRRATLLKFPTFPASASTWKSDTLWAERHMQNFQIVGEWWVFLLKARWCFFVNALFAGWVPLSAVWPQGDNFFPRLWDKHFQSGALPSQ